MKYIPNMITSTRFVFALLLAFSPPLSMLFWLFYGLAALSDLIDGPIARKLKAKSNFGATLDTTADIFFLLCIMYCVFPLLEITLFSYLCIGAVFLFKAISLVYAYIKYKKIVSYHSYLTKFLALFIFSFPIWIMIVDENLVILVLAALQITAYIEELFITRMSDAPDANTKSIFHLRKQQKLENKASDIVDTGS